MNLLACLARLAQLQHENFDRLALQEAAHTATSEHPNDGRAQLKGLTQQLQLRAARWLRAPDAAHMPCLLYAGAGVSQAQVGEWGVLRGQNAQGAWVSEWWDVTDGRWREQADSALDAYQIAVFSLRQPFVASASPVYQLVRQELFAHAWLLREAVLGGLLLNVIALAVSFYSMQIYDRVVPTGAMQTLLVLTLGVLVAIVFEWVVKRVRSNLYDQLIDEVDQRLARAVYMRFLAIRLDQMPQSVGSLAGQMRGYETVRSFLTSLTTNLLVDAPFALIFMAVLAAISMPLALVPIFFFVLSLAIGLYYRGAVVALAGKSMASVNRKTGLLVETVEGAETIKSGQGGWRMLSRWMQTSDDARASEQQTRKISEHAQQLLGVFQQFAYVLLVAVGALLVSKGELTMGALIACSILSGRVLAPVALMPTQLVQWAHTKSALQGLDQLWALQDDHGQQQPVVPESIRGHYQFESVSAGYAGAKALNVPRLTITPGERVGVLGPIGSGKTTLLRLLSGMYKPQEGRILLDDFDLSSVAKPVLAAHVGYVQQDGRLFAGTLRDNLILGQLDPGDETIMQAARATGLLQTVITPHAKGLQQPIFEGGSGLSGGQRQLVNLTRAFLRQPNIWLLDEPTASMDRSLELQVMRSLKQVLADPQHTLVLVTHKAELLELVDRVIVIANHQIVMDGPKAHVLTQLNAPAMERSA
jgi:ATP-binding cassette subfamily C protein LapB